MKISEPTTSHLLLYPGLSQWKLLATPYIIPPWIDWHILTDLLQICKFSDWQSFTSFKEKIKDEELDKIRNYSWLQLCQALFRFVTTLISTAGCSKKKDQKYWTIKKLKNVFLELHKGSSWPQYISISQWNIENTWN